MKATGTAKKSLKSALGFFEEIEEQLGKPIMSEAAKQIGGFSKDFGWSAPRTIAHEELSRARQKKEADEKGEEDDKTSGEQSEQIVIAMQQEYHLQQQKSGDKEQQQMQQQMHALQEEIGKLAKAAGVETKVHLERAPKKIGPLDINRLVHIVRSLRLKADSSKSGQEITSQRENAKRATGMLAWVSGKQMKVHEQGTLTLQG